MKYACVEACEKAFPVNRVCQVLDVSESGYYAWLKRPTCKRKQANQNHYSQDANSETSLRGHSYHTMLDIYVDHTR